MCTLIIQYGVDRSAPLRVAANRDEQLRRPAEPPRLRAFGPRPSLAPLDGQAKGTWIGLNANRLVVAITNRFSVPRDRRRPSRGALVTEALAHASARIAFDTLVALDGTTQNGFHLVLADAQDAFVIVGDGARIEGQRLVRHTHIITERSFGAGTSAREDFLSKRITELSASGPPTLDKLGALLRLRTEPSFDGPLVHLPDLEYGTRSSTLIELGTTAQATRFLHADGPPDRVPYVPYDDALRALFAAASPPGQRSTS